VPEPKAKPDRENARRHPGTIESAGMALIGAALASLAWSAPRSPDDGGRSPQGLSKSTAPAERPEFGVGRGIGYASKVNQLGRDRRCRLPLLCLTIFSPV
jgi:hypothetical protein